MKLTDRDKIAHLYRRLSFGGTMQEIEDGVSAGLDATIKKLIDYDTVPSNFPVHPYEFVFKENEEAEFGIWRFRLWWVLSMASTKRPFQDKMMLFWHSHFAVSDAKVEHASLMLEYLQVLRKHANGKFGTLLKEVAKSPAMMKYLDMDRAFRGRPNENFAREVMELFTMGIGNYTEKDVQEVARALTGWGYVDTFWEGGDDNTKRLMTLYRDKRPAGAFCYFPNMRDSEPKTILGVTKDFDGDQVIEFLALRPETAKYMCRKLWEFFAYAEPDESVIAPMIATWSKTGGDIKQVMLTMVKSPEFYSEKCVLRHFKSPADYVVGLARQMGLGEYLVSSRAKDASPTKPINQEIIDQVGAMTYHMFQMGLDLCYPKDVNGWQWGESWISPSMMVYRMRFHGMMIWNDKGPYVAAKNTQAAMIKAAPKTPEELYNAVAKLFDLNLTDQAKQSFIKFYTKEGPECYKDINHWSGVLYNSLKMLSGCPDMHVC